MTAGKQVLKSNAAIVSIAAVNYLAVVALANVQGKTVKEVVDDAVAHYVATKVAQQ